MTIANKGKAAGSWMRYPVGVGIALGALGGLAVLLPGPWYQLGWLGLGAAFTMLEVGGWMGAAAAALGAVMLLVALLMRRRPFVIASAVALAMGVATAAWPLYMQHRADAVPPIHDITTDTRDVPAFQALAEEREQAPNAVEYPGEEFAAQQREAYPGLESRRYTASLGEVFEAAEAAAALMQWQVVAADRDAGRIEAVAVTPWYGFRDDVVVRLRADDGEVTVDVRSASRIGRSDIGVNAERIREYLATLDNQLGGS